MKSRTTLVVFLFLLFVFLVVNALMVGPYVLAVLMGAILSLLSFPFYRRLTARGLGAKSSSAIVTLAVLVLVIGPLTGLVSLAIQQSRTVVASIARSESLSLESVIARVNRIKPIHAVLGDAEQVEERIRAGIEKAGSAISGSVLSAAGALPEKILQGALALLTCFFLLIDGRKFVIWLNDKIPLDRDVRSRLYGAFRDTSISTIWATLAAAGVQAAMMGVGFWVLGLPGAALAAGATFIFAWIPVLGSTPVWVVGAIYLYTQHSIGKMVVLLALGAMTGVADNFVRPMVLKGRSDMHPLVSLVAIFGGIQMFGIFGVFLGPILTAALLALLTIWPSVARRFGLVANGPWADVEETPAGILVEPLPSELSRPASARGGSEPPAVGGPTGNA